MLLFLTTNMAAVTSRGNSNCSCLLCESLLVKWTFLLLFLLEQYSEYEKVVIEDRVAKEQARRKAEQEEEELKAATKVGFRGQRNNRGGGGGG